MKLHDTRHGYDETHGTLLGVYKTTSAEFWEEQDLEPDEIEEIEADLESKDLLANTKIYIKYPENNAPALILETEKPATISCKGFGVGYTSDHWLIIQEQGDDGIFAIYNEPADVSDEYDFPGIILQTN